MDSYGNPTEADQRRDTVRWPYLKIVRAAFAGTGTSLTPEECSRMSQDDAISALAEVCGLDCDDRNG